MKVAYDFDGVLAQSPPPGEIPWAAMTGPQRAARRMFLVDWYRKAPRLYDPKEPSFEVVSARKEEPEIRFTSALWLERNYPGRCKGLHLLQRSRTLAHVVEFKAGVLRTMGATDFTEDNPQVLKGLASALGEGYRLWLYRDGKVEPWPVTVVGS